MDNLDSIPPQPQGPEELRQKIKEILDFPVYNFRAKPGMIEDPRKFVETHTEEENRRFYEENYEMLRSTADFAELVLVILGEQPATDVRYFFEDEEAVEHFISLLSSTGVIAEVIKKKEAAGKVGVFLIAARTEENLEKMKRFFDEEGALSYKEGALIYGELMGYPDTAINAFINEENRQDREEYEKRHKFPGRRFANFVYSKDHADEEHEVFLRRQRLIREYAPQLFE